MCTVSVIATPGGYRLVHSRDEQRTRSAGEPPSVSVVAGLRVVSPRDPDAGGTWLAARSDGVTLAIMNVNPEDGGPRGERSRGLIVRDLSPVETRDLASAVGDLDCGLYSPFRLVAARLESGLARVDAWTWRGEGVLEHDVPEPPVCWASSGLGDEAVRARLPLFADMVETEPTAAAQDAYHGHGWPGRGAESVLMSREDARTVSVTTVELGLSGVRMVYSEVPDGVDPGCRPGSGVTGLSEEIRLG